MRLGSWLLAGKETGLTTLFISSRRTRDSKNLKWSLEELKDMSSGQIVGVLCRPITGLGELPALANSTSGSMNVGHLHTPIRAEGGPQSKPPPVTRNGHLFFEPRVPDSLEA